MAASALSLNEQWLWLLERLTPGSYLFTRPDGNQVLQRWWAEAVRPRLAPDVAPLLEEIFRYDVLTKPVCPADQAVQDDAASLRVVLLGGELHYLRRGVILSHDVPAARRLAGGPAAALRPPGRCWICATGSARSTRCGPPITRRSCTSWAVRPPG